MEPIDAKTIMILYVMCIGISIIMYSALSMVIGLIVAKSRKLPLLTYLKKACALGVVVGAAAGTKLADKELAKSKSKAATTTASTPRSIQSMEARLGWQNRMQAIIEMAIDNPSKIDQKTREEFYLIAITYVDGDREKLGILKFNQATAYKVFMQWVFKDAADSFKLGRVIKSARRSEIEAAMLESDPNFKKKIAFYDSYIESVANKTNLNPKGKPFVMGQDDIERSAKEVSAAWAFVESLFDPPVK